MPKTKTKKVKCPGCKKMVVPEVTLRFLGVKRRDNGVFATCTKCGHFKKIR